MQIFYSIAKFKLREHSVTFCVCFSHGMGKFVGVSWRGVQINLVGDGVEQPVSKSIVKLIEKILYSGKKCDHTFDQTCVL